MEKYHILERIGEGSFGKVYRGRRKYSGHVVALKFVSKQGKSVRDLENLRQEIRILHQSDHCNIIAMMDSFETDKEFCMVTEYAQGELFQVIKDERSLSECEIRRIAIQLVQALHALHSNNIIHRDIKPQNILIGSKQQIKLCDFGFARAITNDASLVKSIKGTPLYMAPELLQEKPYNHTVDLWSLGVILYELAVGKPPFYTERIVLLIQMIVRDEVDYPSTMSVELQSFLKGLLNKDPAKRLKWPEILEHPFVQETPKQLETRLQLERQAHSLPRFSAENELHDAFMEESEAKSEPRKECLNSRGERKTCDSDTREQFVRLPHPVKNTLGQTSVANEISKYDPPLHRNSVKGVYSVALENFMGMWDLISREVDLNRMESVDLLFANALGLLLSFPACALSSNVLTRIGSMIHCQYRSLMLKKLYGDSDLRYVLESNDNLRRFLTGLVSKSEEVIADNEQVTYVICECMRYCMLCTTIINNAGKEVAGQLNYHELCKGNVDVIVLVLSKQDDVVANFHAKAVKWLGSMIHQSRNLTTVLEVVCLSRLIQTLCNILHASVTRSPDGERARNDRKLLPSVLRAITAFVQPDAKCWDSLQPFPMMSLVHDGGISLEIIDQQKFDDAHPLRTKVHAEVGSQLYSCGVHDLFTLLDDEIDARARTKEGKNDDTGERNDTEDAGATQSNIVCILVILRHACETSSPAFQKLTPTKLDIPNHRDSDILSFLLKGMSAGSLRRDEQRLATELLMVIMRHKFVSGRQIWCCAQVLFPIFLDASDPVLLSALGAFFAEMIDMYNVGKSLFGIVNNVNALTPHEQELWNLVVHGAITQRCADAVFCLFTKHQADDVKIASEAHTLTKNHFRIRGMMDSGVVFLLRVAHQALSQAQSIKTYLAVLEHSRVWETFDLMMAHGGNNSLSPRGLICFLKLLRIVLELQRNAAHVVVAVNKHVLLHLVHLLDLTHIKHLVSWPDATGGGKSAVKSIVRATIKILVVQSAHSASKELLITTHDILYNARCLPKLLDIFRFAFSTQHSQLETSALELPMSFLSKLVTRSKQFGSQFVQSNGLRVIIECGMLRTSCLLPLIIDTLSIVSQLARSLDANYDYIGMEDLLLELGDLLEHPEALVREKSLNCIGRLCRYSTTFCQHFIIPSAGSASTTLLSTIISRLSDPHSHVRRFACFAIGNAAYHSDDISDFVRPAFPTLVQNLHDGEDETRSNAAGALGNFVRNSSQLCKELCIHQVPWELFRMAMIKTSMASRRTALFSLRNFCFYPECCNVLANTEPNSAEALESLYNEVVADEESRRSIRRILLMVEVQVAEGK